MLDKRQQDPCCQFLPVLRSPSYFHPVKYKFVSSATLGPMKIVEARLLKLIAKNLNECASIFRLKFGRSEFIFPEPFHFGPAAAVATIDIVDLTSNSARVTWNNHEQACAEGFQIELFILTNSFNILLSAVNAI